MAVVVNETGNINVSNEVLATIVGQSVEQCYGIVDMSSSSASDGLWSLLHKDNYSKGITVKTNEDELEIDVYVIVEYGVSIDAVAHVVIDTIAYNIESLTGIKTSKVNVHIQDVRVE